MIEYLPNWEIGGYFTLHFVFLFYSSYRVFTYGKLIHEESSHFGFSDGWKIIGRPKDDIDHEWYSFKNFVTEQALFFIIHMIMSQVMRMLKPKSVSYCYATISFLFLLQRYGAFVTIAFSLSTLLMYFVSKKTSKAILWTLGFIYLIILNILKTNSVYDYIIMTTHLDDQRSYEVLVIFAWILLKCISYGIESIESRQGLMEEEQDMDDFSLQAFLGYVFYFPTMYFGPIMIYSRFRKTLNETSNPLTTGKILKFLFEIIMAMLWTTFLECALHFFYIHNLQDNYEIVTQLDSWALYGLGYLLGQFFHIKYVICYGIGIAFARLDGIDPPKKPKCITRIHLYSDMWKHFDHGLYEFLFKYIYSALCLKTSSIQRKFIASFITFLFIYIWHGFYFYIFIWSFLNYLCVTIESFSREMSRTSQYRNLIEKYFSKNWEYRWNGAMGTLLLIPAIISNFFFFTNYDVGLVFMQRTFFDGFLHYMCVFSYVICTFFTSEFIKRREQYVLKQHHN
ncbi:Protein-cysteine N-palmitoyltransferase Rasp [Sergentomyia squamirostris]